MNIDGPKAILKRPLVRMFLIWAFTWSFFLYLKVHLFDLTFPLGTDPAEHIVMSENVELHGGLADYGFEYPAGYHVLLGMLASMTGAPYHVLFKLTMVMGYGLLYGAAFVLGRRLFGCGVLASVFAMFIMLNPDILRFFEWGGYALLFGVSFFLLAMELYLRGERALGVGRSSAVLFMIALVIAMSHLTSLGAFLVLIFLMVVYSMVVHHRILVNPIPVLAMLLGIFLGSALSSEQVVRVVWGVMSMFMTGEGFVAVAVLLTLMIWEFRVYPGAAVRWTPRKLGRNWPLIAFLALLGLYAFLMLVVDEPKFRTGNVQDMVMPIQLIAEFGVLPLLAWFGFVHLYRERDAEQRPIPDRGFRFFFLLGAVLAGYVLVGTLIGQYTARNLPFSDAQRFFILLNVPLTVFMVACIRKVFWTRTGLPARVLVGVLLAGSFVFANLASESSIEHTNYQSPDTEAAVIYAADLHATDRSLLVTHELLWVAVMLHYDELPDESREHYYLEGPPERQLYHVPGIFVYTKEPKGEMPGVGPERQKLYLYDSPDDGLGDRKLGRTMLFENGECRIFASM